MMSLKTLKVLFVMAIFSWISVYGMTKNDVSYSLGNLVDVLTALQQQVKNEKVGLVGAVVEVDLSEDEADLLKSISPTINNMLGDATEGLIGLPSLLANNIRTIVGYALLIKNNEQEEIKKRLNGASFTELIALIVSLDFLAIDEPTVSNAAFENLTQRFSSLLQANPNDVKPLIEQIESAFSEGSKIRLIKLLLEKERLDLAQEIISKGGVAGTSYGVNEFQWSFDNKFFALGNGHSSSIGYIQENKWQENSAFDSSSFVWNKTRNILANVSHLGLNLWNAENGSSQSILQGSFNMIDVNSNDTYIAVAHSAIEIYGSPKKTLFILEKQMDNTWVVKRQVLFDQHIHFSWSPSGNYFAWVVDIREKGIDELYIGDTNGKVASLGQACTTRFFNWDSHVNKIFASPFFAWNKDGSSLLVCEQIWFLKNNTWTAILATNEMKTMRAFKWNPAEKDSFAFIGDDHKLYSGTLIDAGNGEKKIGIELLQHDKDVYHLDWNSSGQLLVAGGANVLYLCQKAKDKWNIKSKVFEEGANITEITVSKNDFLAVRTESKMLVMYYTNGHLDTYFDRDLRNIEIVRKMLFWGPDGNSLAIIAGFTEVILYSFALLSDLYDLSLEQITAYILRKENREVPATLQNVTLPNSLEKTLG